MNQPAPPSIYHYPEYYDILFGWDRVAETLFYDAAFQVYGLDLGARLLEIGCGTGQVGLRLARFGWQVTGLDLEPAMLEYLKTAATTQETSMGTLLADMTAFVAPVPFDGAFCPIGSLGHLPGDEAVRKHFVCMAAALRPGGLYALDLSFVEGETRTYDYTEIEWEMSRGDVTVELDHGEVIVTDPALDAPLHFPWSNRLREFNAEHFLSLVESANAFTVRAWHPQVDETDEGIPVFDIGTITEPPIEDRSILILQRNPHQ